jgi:hypothetical protein
VREGNEVREGSTLGDVRLEAFEGLFNGRVRLEALLLLLEVTDVWEDDLVGVSSPFSSFMLHYSSILSFSGKPEGFRGSLCFKTVISKLTLQGVAMTKLVEKGTWTKRWSSSEFLFSHVDR